MIGGIAAAPAQAERVATEFTASAGTYTSIGQDIAFPRAGSGFRWRVANSLRVNGQRSPYRWYVDLGIGPDGQRTLDFELRVSEGEGAAPTVAATPAAGRCSTGLGGEGGSDPTAYCVVPFPSAIGGKTLRVVVRSLTPTSTTGSTWQAYAEIKGGARYELGSLRMPAAGAGTVDTTVSNFTEDWNVYGTCPAARVEAVYRPPTFRRADGTATAGALNALRGKTCAASQVGPFMDGAYHRLGN
ncbi:hypothetical protein DVA67_009785 [Solirubrobacter sp. CPCC 204708]|uniref:Uncharacterized protein n=1 Tax=Solirubrobacter deserti TaxID=2282478 RepID=A0ABT4RU04_9ACTN|nr:hypothetical protein [Solirubrobacter deserti]MBE2316266.1 hypothetical protein [Solirubrobacter deserti]MDA0142054.1 hypothetical protein [Solirubrobacter deserti]